MDFKKYDYIFAIDTPEILEMTKQYEKIFIECHTAYKDNRQYIKKLPKSLAGVIVPSEHFKEDIKVELKEDLQKKLFVLENFVPQTQLNFNKKPYFNKIPICYLGRMDKLKNTEEVIDIFEEANKKMDDRFMLVLAGPIQSEMKIDKIIKEKNLENKYLYLPPIPFHKVPQFLQLIGLHNGIFISASKGESFGLSVAEAIVNELPVLLSDNHHELVNGNSKYLYTLGDIDEAVQKLADITQDYQSAKKEMIELKNKYGHQTFIKQCEEVFLS